MRTARPRRPVRRGLVVAVALVLALLLSGHAAPTLAQGPPASSVVSMDDPVMRAARERNRQATEGRLRERQSPEARDRRLRSRTEHRDLPRDEAVSLARRKFPRWLAAERAAGHGLSKGRVIDEYVDANTAIIETATGEPAGVLYSTEPLLTHDDGEPIDLSLERTEDAFRPKQTRERLTLPTRADGAARFDSSGIEVAVVGSTGAEAVEESGRLFYPNVYGEGEGVDYVLTATHSGLEAFWQIRSAQDRESFRLRFDLPAGAALTESMATGVRQVTVVRDGQTIAVVQPATAVDASGEFVPVDASVEGNELVLTMRHQESDFEYPILLDPVIEGWSGSQWNDSGNFSCGRAAPGANNNRRLWWFNQSTNGGSTFIGQCSINATDYGSGVWTSVRGGQYYVAGSVGQWQWTPPALSYISELAISGVNHAAYATAAFGGVVGPPGWVVSAFQDNNWTGGYWEWSTARGNAVPRYDDDKVVVGMMSRFNGNYAYGTAGARGVSVILRDGWTPDPVSFTHISVRKPDGTAPGVQWRTGQAVPETVWFDPATDDLAVQAQATDLGLGLKMVALVRRGATPSNDQWIWGPTFECKGDAYSVCPGYWKNPSVETVQPQYEYLLPEGVSDVWLRADDINGLSGYGHPYGAAGKPQGTYGVTRLRVDRTAPVIDVPQEAMLNQTLYGSSYRFSITARDGTAGSTLAWHGSGVTRMRITVDGNEKPLILGDNVSKTSPEWTCDSNCARTVEFDLKTWEQGFGGQHEIKIEAWDALGHRSEKNLKPTYYPTSIRHGGVNGIVDTATEVSATRNEIQAQAVDLGDRIWWALMPADRTYVAADGDPTDPQQMCREAFTDSIEGYESFCLGLDEGVEFPVATASSGGGSDGTLRGKMTPEERDYCILHPTLCPRFLEDAYEAYMLAEALWSGRRKDSEETRTNSFQHAVWLALMVNSLEARPEEAWAVGVAHEQHRYDTNPIWNNTSLQIKRSQMDIINNHVGHKIALQVMREAGDNPLTDESACRRVFARIRDHALYFGGDVYPRDEYERRGHAPEYFYPVYRKMTTFNGGFEVRPFDIDECSRANN